jgi:anion-transporting  ArsA/GET3 family ATPase
VKAPFDPERMLVDRRILVCVGTGGVGKTTLAAGLALAAARRGRRVAVLTIDPARRLADALGVASLGNEPTDLPRERLTALGVPPEGRMAALMLDMKRTFDALVTRFAESEEARERILGNRIYQHVSDALAGSAEYSAMEKVFELSERDDFDLIVVDTPPSQHALDFLEAPRRLVEFLDSRLVQILLHPAFAAGRLGFRLFQRGTERVLRVIEKISGVSFLEDISEFLLAFEGMSEGFRERARQVQARLLGPDAAFVLAASPAVASTKHALAMLERLVAACVPLAGVIVNRVHLWPVDEPTPDRVPSAGADVESIAVLGSALTKTGLDSGSAERAARAALECADGYAAWVRADAASTAELERRVAGIGGFVRRVPELAGDVHDLEGLAGVSDRLFGPAATARREEDR